MTTIADLTHLRKVAEALVDACYEYEPNPYAEVSYAAYRARCFKCKELSYHHREFCPVAEMEAVLKEFP